MATTIPTPQKSPSKSTGESVQPGRAQTPDAKAAGQKQPAIPGKNVNLDVVRKEIANVEVVDTDFVLTTQSGRKILIRDGALHAVTDEDFSVVFSDEETVSGKMLFAESQNSAADVGPLKWSSGELGESSASFVVPAAVLGSTVSYKALGGAALLAAAAVSKKKNTPSTANDAEKAKDALAAIGKFADENSESMPLNNNDFKYVGDKPTLVNYITAGITGVNDSNLIAAINDALATQTVTSATVNTVPKLQALVDAYNLVWSLANGNANATAPRPTADQYTLIGIKGLEPLGAQASEEDKAIQAAKTKLLGDVIDRKTFDEVNTIKEIEALLSSVSAVMGAIKGGTLTVEQLTKLGIKDVTENNIALVIKAIDGTNDDGTEVDTVFEIQNLVNIINGGTDARRALDIIVQYAQANEGVPPNEDTYMAAGVTTPANAKVTNKEAVAFNNALLTPSVTGDSVNSVEKLQSLVDAYRKVFVLADGLPNSADDSKDLTQDEYQRIGANISNLNNNDSRLRLLNDIVDGQSFEDVKKIDDINGLIRIANAIQDRATGAASVLTLDDLKKIGIRGITADNLDLLLQAVAKEGALGTDTVQEIQNLLNTSLIDSFTFEAISEDTGVSNRDFITKDPTLVFSGTSKAAEGTKLRITLKGIGANGVALDDIVLDGKVINAKGEWQASNGVALADGDYTLVVQMYDGIQLLPTTHTFQQHVVVDQQTDTNLSNASIAITAITDDTGDSSDFKTTDTTLIYKGTSTAPKGTQVAVKIDGVVYWGAEVKDDGTWSLDNTGQTLSFGNHKVQAFLADRAGNLAASSLEQTVIIDPALLKLESKTTGPIGMSTNLELLFSADVQAGAGKILIQDLTDISTFASIDTTDTEQVSFDGRKVIINPKFDLLKGHQYQATIESGAFKSTTGVNFEGLSDGWTFSAVDPSMTLGFAGTDIELSDGINKAEFESNNLVVKGEISSANLSAVSNTRITKITFTSADGTSKVELTSADSQSNVSGLTWSADGKTWTLANNPSWTSQLATNATYTISAELAADVSSTATTPQTFQSAPVLIDTSAPLLTSITCDQSTLSKGAVAKFTFTFSEDPKAYFNENSLDIAQVNGQAVGKILSVTGSGNTRTVILQANDNVTFTSSSTSPALTLKTNGFKDGAGNIGTVQAGLVYPVLTIDTQGPTVSSVQITGVFTRDNGAENTTGTLYAGDKVKASLTMSENTLVMGVPTFTLVIGNTSRQAKYVSGSGSNVLVFEYTVALGDLDNEGGVTAVGNSLSVGTGRISDLLDNLVSLVDASLGTVSTLPVTAGTNGLIIDAAGASNALLKIQKFADDNTSPFVADYHGTPPTLDDYKNANVKGVTDENIDAINNALATQVITGARIGTVQDLQNVVSAYDEILRLANGASGPALTKKLPNFLQYGYIGIQGVDSVKASLLGDVIDFKQTTDVDTIPKIQTLFNAVAAVMLQAQDISGLTLEQLTNQLNIRGVTADNFAAIKRAIGDTPDSGSAVDTWQELQELVSETAQRASNALSALQTFANENTESAPVTTNNGNYKGTVPRWNTYAATGIGSESNISDDNLASLITDALATEPVTGDRIQTIADLQNLVTAYASIAKLADSSGGTLLNDLPSADAYNQIGVKGFEASTSAASNTKAQLLSDIIDRKRFEDINTIKEIQALADAASAVMANAAGTGSVTVEQLKLLGFDVPSNKIAAVVEAITKTSKDGKDVDTFIELSRLINENLEAVDQAIAQIANFADLNKVSKPTPAGSFEYATTPDIPKPTADTYNIIFKGGTYTVTDAEADAFNDALATPNVTYTSVNTKEKIQALADAYRAVLAAADGSPTDTVVKPTLLQYQLLGVTGLEVTQEATQAQSDQVVASRVSLLGDVIDRKNNLDVDTVLEIQALANIVTRVVNQAKGLNGLTKADLDQLGIQGVTDDNLAAVLKAIDDTADIGTGVDTFKELQDLVVTPTINKFNTALAFIQKYAEEKTDPTQLGSAQDQLTVQTYLDLGINSVNATNLKSMNSALATASVKARQVPTAQAVRDLVNAYIEILAAADEKPGSTIQEKDYTLLGVDNVVGSEVKVRLLSDVIDLQKTSAVDTADELQALAGIVTAVMNSAAEVAGGLTGPDQLTALGVKGVTADNFDKVLRAIQGTINDGSAVDTVIELQKLVNGEIGKQAAALQLIVTFANANTRSRSLDESTPNYTGPVPTRQDYVDAGITGVVTDTDAMSFNDALATSVITGNSVADLNNLNDPTKLQALVDAYRKFFALADGPDNPTTAAYLTSADCALLGVATSVSGTNRLNLLSDIVDRQTQSGVDTIAKINRLAVIANAIQDLAEDQTIARTWSIDDFTLLGIRGVSSANLDDFLKAIKAAVPATTDSVPELQNLLFNSLSVTFTSITEDTGVSTTDFITSDNKLTFKGSSNATDGTTVRISLKLANQPTITTLDAIVRNGAWEVDSGILSDGKYTVSAQLLDGLAPLPKVYAFAHIVEVDKANNDPELLGKTISIDGISNDSGVLDDFKTNDTTLVFSGSTTAAQGSNVGITVDGGPMVYGTVGANNRWEVNNTSQILSGGDHTVVVYLVDKAGNIVVTGAPKTVSIETGALLATPITEGAIASITPLQLTFNKSVVLGTGNINITDESTNTTVKIPVSDGSVVINGATVTIKPTGSNQLIAGRGYRVTIDAGAFKSAGGETFDGLLGANDWRIQVADPSTTITLGGAGVDASNGINAAELNGLTISGLASSLVWSAVSNPKVAKLTFTSTDVVSPHTFSIDTNLNINSDRTWTLANASSWTREFVSGKSYTVKATLTSTINGTDLSVDSNNSTSVLVDTAPPGLVINCNVTQLASGQTALFTFTFDEVPVGFNQSDIIVQSNSGTPVGALSNFKVSLNDPKIYTVEFTPAAGLTLPNVSVLSVAKESYTDSVGNQGKIDVASPNVLIDTAGPSVTKVSISGVTSTNADKAGVLDVGDKIKITLTMSDVTTLGVGSNPIFSFDLGGVTKTATYASGNGTNALVFYYTIVRGDNDDDLNGITATANSLSQAVLLDSFNNVGSLNTPEADRNSIKVDTTASALNALAKAAQDNTASPSVTPLALYQKAGAVNVNVSNLDSYNSALNSQTVVGTSVDTTQEVQDLVDAYNTILNLADRGAATNTFATATQYRLIGVTNLEIQTNVSLVEKARLLSDAIDRKAAIDVDTVPEVQALANAVVAVMNAANNVAGLTRAQLEALGVLRVTDANMPAVLKAIADTNNDGTAVDTVAELQNLVDIEVTKAAIDLISNFAGDNLVSSTTGQGTDFAYVVRSGARKPTVNDYSAAGVFGVTTVNVDAINDALATPDVTSLLTSTTNGIQKVVDAYNAVFALADGRSGTGTNMVLPQLIDIGVGAGTAIATDSNINSKLSLLNNVLDLKTNVNVDTVQEINTLLATVNAIIDRTNNRTASSVTAAQVTNLGITGVTDTNIEGILASVAAQPNGVNIDTLFELQALVDFYNVDAPSVVLASDTGVNTQDGITRIANLTIGAPSSANAKTFVSIDGGTRYVESSVFTSPTTSGTYTALVRQVSDKGYLGQTRSLTFTLDVRAPDAIRVTDSGGSTDTLYYGASDFGSSTPKLIAPKVQLTSDADIAMITLTMGNIDSQGNDRITYKPTLDDALSLTVNTSHVWTIGGVSGVQLNYTYSASTNSGTFQFSSGASRASRVFTNEEVKAIESALGFVTSSRTDSSRTFTFSHTDAAGNSNAASGAGTVTLNIDNKPPSKVLFSGTDLQAESGYYNQFANSQSAAVAIAANIKTPPDTDIAKIQLTIGGAGLNTANDSVLFGGPNNNLKFLDLSRDDGDVGWTVGGVAGVDWVYNAAAKTLTFSLSSKAAFKSFEVAALEASLFFQIRNNLSTTEGARTFTFDHIDLAGWSTQTTNSGATKTIVADFKATSAVDLNGNTSEIDRTALAYFNQTLANTGQSVRIADQMGLTSDTDIARISVVVGGENLTLNEDQVLIDGLQDIRLSDTLVSFGGNATIAKSVIGVSWEYNPASKTLTFTKTNGGNFAASEVQAIERNLAFKTTGNTQGDRTFTFTHFDYAGNASDTATATVKVDTFAPLAIDLSDTLSGVQNTDTRLMKAANLDLGVSVANDMNRASQDEGVVSIQVSANNSAQISSDDRLLFGTVSVAFGGSDIQASAQSISIGNVGNVIWSYRASDKTLIFRKSDNSAFRANEAQTIERALIFQTSATARAGDRLFTFTHADAAGNVSAPATVTFGTDVRAPLVNLSASSQNVRVIDTTPTTATSIVALGANVSEEDRVASFQIRVRGARAGAAEKLIVGGTEIDAVSASGRVGAVSVAVGSNNASNWSWNYNALSGAFVFTATGVVRGVTTDQAAAFLSSLSYRTTTATPGEDVRQFFISATDGIGNTSATEAVSSVVVGNTTPSRSSAAVLDGNDADRLIGDQIVLTFTEPVRVSLVNINTLTVSGGSLGSGASVRAVDSVTVNGTDYATNFLVTSGTNATLNMGQAQTLTLTGTTGGQSNFASQGAAVLPTFTLNSQAITLEAWVYADYDAWGATAGSFQRIFDLSTDTGIASTSSPDASVWLGFNRATGNLAFEYITKNSTDGSRASQGLLIAGSTLPTRSWQHVAATYSSAGTATIYINGLSTGSATFLSALPKDLNFDNNFIGKSNWIADAGFNGSVFDARVYTRVRTAGEIFNDFTGMFDSQDPQLLFQYNFNGNGSNGAMNTVEAGQAVIAGGSRDATLGTNASFALNATSTSITIAAANVEDAAGNIATGAQRFDLFRKSQTIGSGGRDTVVGTTGNDFIAGQGDNDILTGGAGGDTFAWFLGETGSDTVTDFKVSDGDMVDLSGILTGKKLGLLSDDDALRPFLQLNKLSNDMELRIDVSGASNFAAPTQIITFTNGANNGLDDTLANLVQSKVINLDNQTSTPLMFDLNGDGVRTTSLTEGNTKFDFDGQGQVVKTGWTDGKDGFLVLDLNKDGKINNGTELFGSGTKLADGQNRAHDGFEALRQYDLNQDNVIDANDAVFANLQVWVDADRDGVSAGNELYDLGTVGVRALNLNAVAGQTLDNGNALGWVSTWVSTNGQQHAFVDVTFATSHVLSQTSHAVL